MARADQVWYSEAGWQALYAIPRDPSYGHHAMLEKRVAMTRNNLICRDHCSRRWRPSVDLL